MENANMQTPATVNQISQAKPNIERTFATLSGDIAGSFNGGHNRTVAWFRLMPGQRVKEYKQKLRIKLLTPISPAYQKLRMVLNSYFVPDKRVYADSEEFVAQRGGATESKRYKKPTLSGKYIPFVPGLGNGMNNAYCITETEVWRDSWISSYIPRIGYLESYNVANQAWINNGAVMPDYDATLLRGRIAIFNDFERNKQYDSKITEYNGDTVSNTEWASYLPLTAESYRRNSMRARRNNSYYMDYRTEAQGEYTDLLEYINVDMNKSLVTWADVENSVNEFRAQAENAEKNTWEILHELYGTKRKLSEGKTQLIGRNSFDLNYASVTQNTYNTNGSVQDIYRVMGQQGAYSYTEIEIPCFAGYEAIEGGWVHVIATVTADSVFERAFERTAMNVNWDGEYRPDLKDQKLDTLNYLEVETAIGANGIIGGNIQALGFKRKWSEYATKLPNIIQGDMTSADHVVSSYDAGGLVHENTLTIGQSTHQFYEENAIGYRSVTQDDIMFNKKYHLDYTDLLINKNQAIMNEIKQLDEPTGYNDIQIVGQNQIFFAGKQIITTDLPMDEAIKNNFTNWGEH